MNRSVTTAAPVYVAALFQGLTLVSFPASSDVLMRAHGFTHAQYGAIFLPQVAAAILGAIGGGGLSGRLGLRTIFLLALLANALSQALLALSATAPASLAYTTVLVATAFLGLGFGLTGGPLNTYPRLLFSTKSDTALLVLHSTMGVGLSIGPLLVGWLMMRQAWLAFPVGLAIAGGILTVVASAVVLPAERPQNPRFLWIQIRARIPSSGCFLPLRSSTRSPRARSQAGRLFLYENRAGSRP